MVSDHPYVRASGRGGRVGRGEQISVHRTRGITMPIERVSASEGLVFATASSAPCSPNNMTTGPPS